MALRFFWKTSDFRLSLLTTLNGPVQNLFVTC